MTSLGTQLEGALTGSGSAIVHTLVYHHAVPQEAPQSLADFVESEPDANGLIADWRLSLRKLLANRDEPVHDVWSSFTAWRRTYVSERVVGDVATVSTFLHWADRVVDVSALHALNLPRTKIESRAAATVAWQVHNARDICRQRGEVGVAVSVPQRQGIVRGFVVDEPVLLLADRGTQVWAVADGLEVVDPTLEDGPTKMLVHGWLVDGAGVTALTDEGPIGLGNSRGGRLLCQVAPGVVHAAVGPAPLSAIFNGLFDAVEASANQASADHLPLYVRIGPRVA